MTPKSQKPSAAGIAEGFENQTKIYEPDSATSRRKTATTNLPERQCPTCGRSYRYAWGWLNIRLQKPVFSEKENSFLVEINHQKLASPETLIMEYLENNTEITNRIARMLTGIRSENSMKNVFYRLRDRNMIEPVPGRTGFSSAWQKIAGA